MARARQLTEFGTIELGKGITNPHNLRFPSLREVARKFAEHNGKERIITLSYDNNLLLDWFNNHNQAEFTRKFQTHKLDYSRLFGRRPGEHILYQDRGLYDSCEYGVILFKPSGDEVRLGANVQIYKAFLGTEPERDPNAPGLPPRDVPVYGKPHTTITRTDSNRSYWFMAPVE